MTVEYVSKERPTGATAADRPRPAIVTPGLEPAIHVVSRALRRGKTWMADERGHDSGGVERLTTFAPSSVMPGLGPGIHAFATLRRGRTWMAGLVLGRSPGPAHDGEERAKRKARLGSGPRSRFPIA
ncbi:MAG TPA: hypothetical protein VHG30_18985 [Microvirga sp.]|nr:hypothetical protein [Microvirga sp.]